MQQRTDARTASSMHENDDGKDAAKVVAGKRGGKITTITFPQT
jgi:hypothetical protein